MPYLPLLLNIGCPPFNKKHPFGPPSVYRKGFAEWGGGERGAPIGNCPMSQKIW